MAMPPPGRPLGLGADPFCGVAPDDASMIASGIKASELIRELEALIKHHGDRECFAGGGDYPEGVECVTLQDRNDPYVPKGSFKIW